MLRFVALAMLLSVCSAYVMPQGPTLKNRRSAAPTAVFPDLPVSLIAEIVDGGGERVYGAVDAPGWIAPVAGIAAIGTALLPILLAPGEEAFSRQQGDEEKVKNMFGDNKYNRK
jgi:hypothetical protein